MTTYEGRGDYSPSDVRLRWDIPGFYRSPLPFGYNEAMRYRFQFSLSTVFVLVTLAAVACASYFGLARMKADAHRQAVRQAILAGRMPPEQGRWCLGDGVDELRRQLESPPNSP